MLIQNKVFIDLFNTCDLNSGHELNESTLRKWKTILVSMLLNILNSLHSRRIDFSTLAYKLDLIKMLFILLIHHLHIAHNTPFYPQNLL